MILHHHFFRRSRNQCAYMIYMAMGHGLTQESIVPPGPSDDLNATQSTQPGKHPSIAYMIII